MDAAKCHQGMAGAEPPLLDRRTDTVRSHQGRGRASIIIHGNTAEYHPGGDGLGANTARTVIRGGGRSFIVRVIIWRYIAGCILWI